MSVAIALDSLVLLPCIGKVVWVYWRDQGIVKGRMRCYLNSSNTWTGYVNQKNYEIDGTTWWSDENNSGTSTVEVRGLW